MTLPLGSGAERHAGSSPVTRTNVKSLGIPRDFSLVDANFSWHKIYIEHKVYHMRMPFFVDFLIIYRRIIISQIKIIVEYRL